MKRILVCIFVFLVTAISIYADEEVVDGVSWGYSLKNGTVTIERRYDSSGFAIYYQGDLVVPNQIKGYPVTTIATYAFQGCPELKSVVLPNSVVEIKSTVGYYNHGAFENCSKLERVTLPKGLKIIEPGTFSGCSSLNQIILPFGLEMIGSEAFYGCSSLLEIDVPSSVVFIDKVADDFIRLRTVPEGDYDNVAACRYDPPDYWTMGAVFGRLATDTAGSRPPAEAIAAVYASPVGRALSNYNTDLFYQPRDYLKSCFDAGRILED